MASTTVNNYLDNVKEYFSKFEPSSLGIPSLVLLILAMLVIPLPPILLDILFTFNILIGLLVIMIAIGTKRPLDFSSFPAVLLLATMLRLSLNVASTRVVLVNGHTGSGAAGQVIESFGEFVVGGNYVVGAIVFGILILINFLVITKGAGRVSEVTARFTLDAMPGKQMAIDADLNAGNIDNDEARKRREELSQESDFFGSMDGASKFVRGDAIAGLLILLINLIGGLIIGLTQHDLSFSEAGRVYSLLTIGDGLVAQIPALFLSLATAIIVTKVTTSESMTEQTKSQLSNPSALFIAASILISLGAIPGMPTNIFLTMGVLSAGLGFFILQKTVQDTKDEKKEKADSNDEPKELDWDDVDQVDLIGLEIGYGLIPLVNPESGGQLMARVKGIRKKLSAELGFLVQPVRIRDALNLEPDQYHIVLNGVTRAKGEVRVGKELAISPGTVYGELEGEKTKDPAFGLDAVWIEASQSDYARTLGYTVVDSSTTIATHLNKILRENASELLGRDETQQLLDKLSKKTPKLVEDLVPGKLPLGTVTKVLQNLLNESVVIKDMRTIIETLSDECGKTQDPEVLTSMVRPKLGRMIIQNIVDADSTLEVMTLEPELEQIIHNVIQQSQGSQEVMLEPGLSEALFKALKENTQEIEELGKPAVLVVSPSVRPWLSRTVKHRTPDLTVLSYVEIPEDQAVKVIKTIELNLKNDKI
jgi:flagellar biosynthesis protein FlhA